ncbi:MAG: hypothetical protein QME96_12195, partial [Myxococcota bacterium]|nr:hypothetical protein [Myxococcota bacterium]
TARSVATAAAAGVAMAVVPMRAAPPASSPQAAARTIAAARAGRTSGFGLRTSGAIEDEMIRRLLCLLDVLAHPEV